MTILARSDAEPIPSSVVPLIVSDITIAQYFQVATLTVLTYDFVITIEQEARYFWKLPRKPVDYVFFINRYSGILSATAMIVWNAYNVNIALSRCNFAGWTRNISGWLLIISIDYILMIRVLALYSQDRKLKIFLNVFLALETTFGLGMLIYGDVLQRNTIGALAEGVTACGTDVVPSWKLGIADWMVPMIYGLTLMVLALYKAAEYWKMSAGFKGFTLVKVLIEDQILYFVLVFACCMFAILHFKLRLTSEFLSNLFNCLGNPAFLSVLGSRMLFNLKEAGERGLNEGTSFRTQSRTVSDINFAEIRLRENDAEDQEDERVVTH